jgi:hypothetical protein
MFKDVKYLSISDRVCVNPIGNIGESMVLEEKLIDEHLSCVSCGRVDNDTSGECSKCNTKVKTGGERNTVSSS